MAADGFPLRSRAAHIPDFIRRLERISGSVAASRSVISLQEQQKADLAPVFADLTAWVDAEVQRCRFHAGFRKTALYAGFLRVVVEEMVMMGDSHSVLLAVRKLDAYLSYLRAPGAVVTPRKPDRRLVVVDSPRQNNLKLGTRTVGIAHDLPLLSMVSPRALRSTSNQSTRSLLTMRLETKRIVELSDHESVILELALYFDEMMTRQSRMQHPKNTAAVAQDLSSTERWALLSSEHKTKLLKQIKRRLAKNTFFEEPIPNTLVEDAHQPPKMTENASSTLGHGHGANRGPRTDLSSQFSLVVLCLHETIRRLSVFSSDIAHFAWQMLLEQTVAKYEALFAVMMARHSHAKQELQVLRQSKAALQQATQAIMREIELLQAQNVRSLHMWNLEKSEITHLEDEERWHGHCKALIVSCIAQLEDAMQLPAWLHEFSTSNSLVSDADEWDEQLIHAELIAAELSANCEQITKGVTYHRLPMGASLFHFRMRPQLMYIAHLLLLCRSFLHLHERRDVRDVMDSTSITGPRERSEPSVSQHNNSIEDAWMNDTSSFGLSHTAISNPMEKISLSELQTLCEINTALRSIEVLYAETGSLHHVSQSRSLRPPREQASGSSQNSSLVELRSWQRHVGTQFPTAQTDGGTQNFMRSLSYCTIAATNFSRSSSFLPAGFAAKLRNELETHSDSAVMAHPVGSGRRRGSASFHARTSLTNLLAQPLLRLNKAMAKIPAHIKGILLLPLLEQDPFPLESPLSVAVSLTKEEILDKIHWIFSLLLERAYPSGINIKLIPVLPDERPISLVSAYDPKPSTGPHSAWTSEDFVAFIHAAFVDTANGNIRSCETELVRFFSSIQLLYSSAPPPGPASSSSGAVSSSGSPTAYYGWEFIQLFSTLTRLYSFQRADGKRARLPPRVFPVFCYCLRVLQHVTIVKQALHSAGEVLTIWVLAGKTEMYGARGAGSEQNATQGIIGVKKRQESSLQGRAPPYVLLESVKTLLIYLLMASSDGATIAEQYFRLLRDRAAHATVSLLTPVTPGPYQAPGSTTAEGSSSGMVNGQLTEAWILPMDVAIPVLVKAWLHQHQQLEDRIEITFQGGLNGGQEQPVVTFDEFSHIMTTGWPVHAQINATGGGVFALTPAHLSQMYAAALTGKTTKHSSVSRAISRGAQWHDLVQIVLDEVDFMDTQNRLRNVDFRSIQHALTGTTHASSLARTSHVASWLTNPLTRGGGATVQALQKAWDTHHSGMQERFLLSMQADQALDGVCCWQNGTRWLRAMQRLLTTKAVAVNVSVPTSESNSAFADGNANDQQAADPQAANVVRAEQEQKYQEGNKEDLDIAWRIYYSLQMEDMRAHHFADQVRVKQARLQQQQQQRGAYISVIGSKSDEIRPQQPSSPPRASSRRTHASSK